MSAHFIGLFVFLFALAAAGFYWLLRVGLRDSMDWIRADAAGTQAQSPHSETTLSHASFAASAPATVALAAASTHNEWVPELSAELAMADPLSEEHFSCMGSSHMGAPERRDWA